MVDVEAEHFSLRWNNFHSNLSTGFQALLQEEDLVDVTLAAGGEFVQAHKIVLSVCSPYFKQLFKVNPCKHPIVILKDVCHKDLVDILQFMYQGEVNVRQEDLATFLQTAELLQVKGLTGRDSPADSHEKEPPPHRPIRTAPKPRSARSMVDKLSLPKQHMHLPVPVDKKSSADPEDAIARAPPYKRMRSEPPVPVRTPPSPQTVSEDTVEFSELTRPKEEPVDSDVEQVDEKLPQQEGAQDDTLLQLLSADSSHGAPPSGSAGQSSGAPPPGVGMSPVPGGGMVSIPSASLDSNLSQEGSQGELQFITSSKGRLQLVHNGFIFNTDRRKGSRIFWRCTQYHKIGCRGRCITLENRLLVTQPSHNHVAGPTTMLSNVYTIGREFPPSMPILRQGDAAYQPTQARA